MKSIIKNKSKFNFLKKPIETLERSNVKPRNQEILRLYRDVWKMTNRFTWNNEDGEPWKDILRKSSRQEFEQIRNETDSVKIGKFMITWKDTIMRIDEKINKAQMEIMTHVDDTRTDRLFENSNDYKDGF